MIRPPAAGARWLLPAIAVAGTLAGWVALAERAPAGSPAATTTTTTATTATATATTTATATEPDAVAVEP
ncbi:MAG TPA: hypothetical protein VF997_22480, partial [Polyangia bacterium]